MSMSAMINCRVPTCSGKDGRSAAHAGVPVTEYASKTVKRAVVGTGGAEKRQVAMMVQTLLPGAGSVKGDAADALAIAICHANASNIPGRR